MIILLRRLKSVWECVPSKTELLKYSPFVSRGSNLYRAPQGKIECNDLRNPSIMAQPPRAKQIISLHFSVDYAYLYILYASHFKQLSLPFSVDYAYLYILYTSYFEQLLSSVVCKLCIYFLFWSGNCVWSFYYGDWKVFVNASLRKPN